MTRKAYLEAVNLSKSVRLAFDKEVFESERADLLQTCIEQLILTLQESNKLLWGCSLTKVDLTGTAHG
jgi:hypothetical protein